MKHFQFFGLLLLALSLAPRTAQAWLLSQTRREMMGVTWTTLSSLAVVEPAVSSDKQKEEKERKQKEKEEQRERDRVARETKARLAAGRIGTI
eukprot:scaffold1353_cov161-Amphora_coffeaeformis.AAC.44